MTRDHSERRSCQLLGCPRSIVRYEPRPDHHEALRTRPREVARPNTGYRQAWMKLRGEYAPPNHKRVHRLWKQERLALRRRYRKFRTGNSLPCKAEYPNHVWCLDFCFDCAESGSTLKMLAIRDEFTRECHEIEVATSLPSRRVRQALERLFAKHGVPRFLRSDNGPEFICRALTLWLRASGTESHFIDPGCPWQNDYAESFISRFRAECLDVNLSHNVADAQIQIGGWCRFYDEERPQKVLGGLPPAAAAAQIRGSGRATPSLHLESAVSSSTKGET